MRQSWGIPFWTLRRLTRKERVELSGSLPVKDPLYARFDNLDTPVQAGHGSSSTLEDIKQEPQFRPSRLVGL
jgi:hypothetical protein